MREHPTSNIQHRTSNARHRAFIHRALDVFNSFPLLLILVFAAATFNSTAEEKTNRADLHVSGFGLIGNLELKRQIRLMQPGGKSPVVYNANQIEDIVAIILAKVQQDGFLLPTVSATLTSTNGEKSRYQWDRSLTTLLPQDTAAQDVRLRVHKGVRFYYENLELTGVQHVKRERAEEFFVYNQALLPFKSLRVWTPEQMNDAMDALKDALERRGYRNAKVTVQSLERNDKTGSVRVKIAVDEGLPSVVRSVAENVFHPDATAPAREVTIQTNVPFSPLWQQDALRTMRTNAFFEGYPDADVNLSVTNNEVTTTNIQVDVAARVDTGPFVRVAGIDYVGATNTRKAVLRRFVRLKPGDPLNPVLAESAREKMARLGIFDSVTLRYEDVKTNAGSREVIYELKEGRAFDISLLAGYGAYDQLGGGIELEHRNLWGRAHDAKLTAAQTFKSTLVDFRYTVPQIFSRDYDLFFSSSLLRREEITYEREEYGGAIGVHHYFAPTKTDASLRYDYQILDAQPDIAGSAIATNGPTSAGAFILEVKHDRRDNPLAPRRGYDLFTSIEIASDSIGGEANYQRIILGGAAHVNLGGGRVFHVGASHGVTFTLGGADELPFNKRFFPGGDNSVRGYQHGEAAPRDNTGQILGAETYLQGNVELEQYLTRNFSIVAFVDGVTFAEQREDYPGNTGLFSVGGGIRWRTPIGPVRLEYGYNLNPRHNDPSGTIQFAFGFPF